MNFVLIGYFPKIVVVKPEWLKDVPIIEDIYSVSDCISTAPPNWIDQWKHNEMWKYDTPELAWSVVPKQDRERYSLFAYRILPRLYDASGESTFSLPRLNVSPLPRTYISQGFDAVSRSMGNDFECSPLSCNYMAREYPVNKHCLIADLDTVVTMAKTFAVANPEPGPYCVVEVLMEQNTEKSVITNN